MKHWLLLCGAILCEVAGTTSMKLSNGFTKPLPSSLLFILYGTSFYLLTLALKEIDLGIAYAIWAGVGTALIAIIGFSFFEESVTVLKVACILLIIAGVVGLKLGSDGEQHEPTTEEVVTDSG